MATNAFHVIRLFVTLRGFLAAIFKLNEQIGDKVSFGTDSFLFIR